MNGLEARIHERLMEWGKGLPDFERSHADIGTYFGLRYLGERLMGAEEQTFLLGLTFSYWFWMDDRSDRHFDAPVVEWEQLIAAAQAPQEPPRPWSLEMEFLLELRRRMEAQAQTHADREWWRETLAQGLRAYAREEQVSRSGQPLSYAEYLVIGADSCAVMNLTASASLLGGLGLGARRFEPALARGLRYLCTTARLENDLHSYERDRQEGGLANAVLTLERMVPAQHARQFVRAEHLSYQELLNGVLAELGPRDPFTWFARNALACHEGYYKVSRARNRVQSG